MIINKKRKKRRRSVTMVIKVESKVLKSSIVASETPNCDLEPLFGCLIIFTKEAYNPSNQSPRKEMVDWH